MRLFAALLLLAAHHANASTLDVTPWPLPTGDTAAAQPDLARAPDGSLLLGWIEAPRADDAPHRFRLARERDGAWNTPRDIAQGHDFFVNWADIPHVFAARNGRLFAHWLRRNSNGPYDYGIALVESRDDGATWSAPRRIEPDGAALDYGFVSLWDAADGGLGLAWLDSRRKPAGDAHAAHAHHGEGAMTLRSQVIAADGAVRDAVELDASTCDCCPTSVAITARGPVVAYRGRTADEIRDIRIVAHDGTRWSTPRTVHADGWRIAGCPVNGPSIAASGDALAVAWYTEAGGTPTLRIARSGDAGATFSAPHEVQRDDTLLGRAALAGDADAWWLAWLVRDGDGQALWLARFDPATLAEQARVRVARLAARGPASGLPRLQLRDGIAHLVWTDVHHARPRLRGARVQAMPAQPAEPPHAARP